MRVGLHFSAYESAEFLDKFLAPWLEFKSDGGHELIISAGHVCFKEFQEMGFPVESKDGTCEMLAQKHKNGEIDYFSFTEEPLTEAEARTEILKPLLEQNIDCLVISAPDEIFDVNQIKAMFEYVKKDPFLIWYRLEYKNLTFSEQKYIKGFAPPRIFFNDRGYKIIKFRADDEILYEKNGQIIDYLQLPNKQVPFHICSPLHYSWLDNKRSRDKVLYQEKRWNPPNGNGCSFRINESGKLDWNLDFYKRIGQVVPELFDV